ncbi:MAG TPA: penicillin-binding protein activator [Croceibacterium sp.]|nr:penicillin-binding protein activator [Croceibacterium sp.]
MLAITQGSFGRALAVGMLTVLLAACKVVPETSRPGPVPTPTPTPGPSENVLPTDTARHRVALLVPLSGENAAVGRSIANATTMALLDTSAQNLRITTYDTATGAGTAAASAIRDGNKLILGPLLREDVTPILAQARPADVPLITFSNDTTIAAPDVFVMGHVPEQSVARTVAYAAAQGARRFAALVPNGDYGRRAGDALSQAVGRVGGTLAAIERYDRGNTSIVSAAQRLKAQGGYDAVLLAEGARLSAMAAAELKEGGAQPMIFGTELWSGEASIAGSAPLRGAWFSAVSDNRYRQFVTSYESRFGEQPYRLATLGYDAVLLALRVARDWQPGRDFPTGRMLADDGFLGLDGPFRFRSTGVGERAMEVRRIGNGSISVVDPAPERF